MSATAKISEIPFNPLVLKWARERLNIGIEQAAKRINVKPERVIAWERGDKSEFPTIRQARLLADCYDRPFLEFFSSEIPNIPNPKLAPDFRFHRIRPNSDEIVALVEIQRWAEMARLNAIDLLDLIGESPTRISEEMYCKIDDNVDAAANKIRELLSFPVTVQKSLNSRSRSEFPKILRELFENIGVLVLKQSGLQRCRTRGICLYDDVFPIIVFGSESPGGTAFTLAHEFAHVLLRQSALSGYPRFGNGSNRKKIEGWCNRFAAAFLMPSDSLSNDLKGYKKDADEISDSELNHFANIYCVSQHAMLIRMVNLGYVKPSFYWRRKRPEFIRQEDEYQGGGRSLYYGSRYRNSIGDLYTGLVLEAWNTGRITNHTAAEFMGIKNLTHLNDIREHFKFG